MSKNSLVDLKHFVFQNVSIALSVRIAGMAARPVVGYLQNSGTNAYLKAINFFARRLNLLQSFSRLIIGSGPLYRWTGLR